MKMSSLAAICAVTLALASSAEAKGHHSRYSHQEMASAVSWLALKGDRLPTRTPRVKRTTDVRTAESFVRSNHDVDPLSGVASWYCCDALVATGRSYDPEGMTAAHKSLPFGSQVKVTRKDTGQSVIVRVNDRGPHVLGRVIDLSTAAARELGIIDTGLTQVSLEVL